MGSLKKAVLAGALAAAFTSSPVASYEAGDFIFRMGGAIVTPNDSSDCFDGPTAQGLGCVKPNPSPDAEVGLQLGYMITDNIGAQLLGATPFNHDVSAEVDGADLGKVAKIKHLPPTLTLNWHFDGMGNFVPFVGAGVNYTHIFNENTTGVLNGLDTNFDDSWGPAGLVGFDALLPDDFMFSMQLYYIKIQSEAHFGGGIGNSDVDIDPWVFFAGFGKSF